MGLVNMLFSLPAGRQMLALPQEQNAPLEAVMRDLREQANKRAAVAQERGNESQVEYWRLVATYAKYVARGFKRENLKRNKSKVVSDLLRAIPAPSKVAAVLPYAGADGFRFPPAAEQECLLEAASLTFAPWVEAGDYIYVDFTLQRLTVDGLYLVAIDGKELAIRGFHRTRSGWYVHDSSAGAPQLVRMLDDRLPAGFEILGLVANVFKNAMKGGV